MEDVRKTVEGAVGSINDGIHTVARGALQSAAMATALVKEQYGAFLGVLDSVKVEITTYDRAGSIPSVSSLRYCLRCSTCHALFLLSEPWHARASVACRQSALPQAHPALGPAPTLCAGVHGRGSNCVQGSRGPGVWRPQMWVPVAPPGTPPPSRSPTSPPQQGRGSMPAQNSKLHTASGWVGLG